MRALRRPRMKTLFVLRHGHAASEYAAGSDHERELTPRGVAEVQRSVTRLVARANRPILRRSHSCVKSGKRTGPVPPRRT